MASKNAEFDAFSNALEKLQKTPAKKLSRKRNRKMEFFLLLLSAKFFGL